MISTTSNGVNAAGAGGGVAIAVVSATFAGSSFFSVLLLHEKTAVAKHNASIGVRNFFIIAVLIFL
jgi:hypothetical protein